MLRKILMAASLVVFANTAIAGTWAPASSGTVPLFATEIFGAATVVITPNTALYTMAAKPNAGTAYNVDYTMTGGTWGAALTSGSLVIAASGGTSTVTLVEGGGITASTAKFRVDVANVYTGNATLTLTYTVKPAAMSTAGSVVKMGVVLADQLGTLDTQGLASNVAVSAAGSSVTFAATGGDATKINVATGSIGLVNAAGAPVTSTDLGDIQLALVSALPAGARKEADGATTFDPGASAGAAVAAPAGGTVTVTGDFAAAIALDVDENPLTLEGVVMSGAGCPTAPTTLTATTATWAITDAVIDTMVSATCAVTMHIPAANTTLLTPFTAATTLSIDYSAATNTDLAASGNLKTLLKNGANVAVDLILTPGGAFDGFVRISNASAIPGKVIVTLYNDAGNSVTFDLTDGNLAAQASTGLVTAQSLYDQAQAADATFAHNGGKLRASFDGEFGDIKAQSITISTDNTTFTTF